MEDQKLEDLSPFEVDEKLGRKLTEFLSPLGFECRPFLTGWYDDLQRDQIWSCRVEFVRNLVTSLGMMTWLASSFA